MSIMASFRILLRRNVRLSVIVITYCPLKNKQQYRSNNNFTAPQIKRNSPSLFNLSWLNTRLGFSNNQLVNEIRQPDNLSMEMDSARKVQYSTGCGAVSYCKSVGN